MSLKIQVKNAKNLPNKDSLGKSDPYVTICFQGEKRKTEVKSGTLDPVWDEELTWVIGVKPPRSDECLDIIVKDYERIGWNKLLGKTSLPLRNILHGTSGMLELEQTLLDDNDQPTTGRLALSLQYSPPKQNEVKSHTKGIQRGTTLATDMSDGVSPDEITPYIEGGMPTTLKSNPNLRSRDSLTNVKTKFQIRIRIVEARQLLGEDISPVCRVAYGARVQQTRVHKSTISPWFDQLFFFHEEKLPKDLMADFIEFTVCNSRVLRSSSVIGAFKCEVGQIYDQPDHAIANKWLVLAHPDEPTPTIQGYLKVSIGVMGPGDVCPSLDASQSDSDDVEGNLLWSAGVHLQPASFTLSIYCAQNLPRMDAGTMQTLKEVLGFGKASKELVDPYVVASYAGKEVQTRVLYTNDNPEFKQQIHLGFLFPSMCNHIRLTLMDWDRVGNDDIIGQAIIPVNLISAAGEEGYLPTFGPSFMPIYGARREWELWEGKETTQMNEGGEEGCSYRGRVLVSLKTNVGNYPPLPTTDMDEPTFAKVKRSRGTRNFVLVAHLTHAYLLKEANRPLEVEVSMGNYGNKHENTILPSPSSTHPSNPLFDGCRYYFLPWGDSCPLVTVPCHWEDVTHRLMASNAILKIVRTLKEHLKILKLSLRSERDDEPGHQTKTFVQECLLSLATFCKNPLPESDPVRHVETSLDIALRKRRKRALEKISLSAQSLMSNNPQNVIEELEIILVKLEELAIEPQNSMPDVFLWLLSGTERLAYVRIPARDIIHAHEPNWAGKIAGQFNSFILKYPEDYSCMTIGGVVRASLWLGREEELRTWWDVRQDLQLTVFAETYENQVVAAPGTGKWSPKGALMRRPPFSDADGLKELPKETFAVCPGWKFQGDWIVDPDPSIKFSLDTGHTMFCEEVFQQQARVPGGTWIDAPTTWSDARGDPATPRDEVSCPTGWQWRDVWTTDLQRAVDCEGWEYTVQKGVTGWSPQEKLYHVLRRRRWIRERQRVGKVEKSQISEDGWEYSSLFSSRFHARERGIDIVRRRRWRRKLVPSEQGLPPTPRIIVKTSDEKDAVVQLTCPRQYVISAELHLYQLRAHIYQARDLTAGDKSGLSDPYAVVSFCGSTQQTEKQSQTLCPTWDQSLVFDEVKLSGPLVPGVSIHQPPSVIVEIYDWDARGEPEFLGRAVCDPKVLHTQDGYQPSKLEWFQLNCGGALRGELLAAFELFLKDSSEDLPMPPPSRGDLFMVPFGIRPLLQKTRIEVLCWGVRNMSTYDLQSVTRPSIEFECGGQRVVSPVMKDARHNPNFGNPHLVFDVELPKEDIYMPPLTLRVKDHRSFGSRPMVATAVVAHLHKYTVEPKAARKKAVLTHTHSLISQLKSKEKHVQKSVSLKLTSTQASIEPGTVDTLVDWWSKYYASTNDLSRCGSYLRKGYERLEIIEGNLEDDKRFRCFTDLIDSIPLHRGRGADSAPVGEFKGTFRLYPIPSEEEHVPKVLSGFPSPDPQEILVRVYAVRAIDLAPKDSGSSSDPYVVVSFGKQRKSGKENYRAGTLNPMFGSVFEVKGTLPLVKDLHVQIWDKDTFSSDDLIGETVIDLENRFLSRYRATVSLQKQYHVSGPNMWRDYQLPSQILEETAKLHYVDGPQWADHPLSLKLDGTSYTLKEFEPKDCVLPPTVGQSRERLALYVLHSAFTLVPEHVESRLLFHPERPGLSQGKVHLWVDVFPSDVTIPPPVDITPRKPTKFILRVCIYNAYEVPLQETNISGERMSDVYVKGWLQGSENVQKTDIHYRCLDGEANFNWRLVYHFDFLEAEQMMVVKRKSSMFSSEESQETRPPRLTLQLWDNDLILSDDYLSEMTLDLCRLPKPSKSLNNVSLPNQIRASVDGGRSASTEGNATTLLMPHDGEEPLYLNLFEVKRVFGYFPFTRMGESGVQEVAELPFKMYPCIWRPLHALPALIPVCEGKLEAEFEVLTEEEAKIRAAGQGRDDPNANPNLPEPKRPATSFFWLTSPWKSFRHVIWKNHKWYIITFFLLIILLIFVLVFLYALPEASVYYMLGAY